MKLLKPCLKPFFGCLNCGGGEMHKRNGVITASLTTRLHDDWVIKADRKYIYQPERMDDKVSFKEYWSGLVTLKKYELLARKHPDRDWRAIMYGMMRYAEYQRQGLNEWVLVKSSRV